ncbi:glycosyltransferase family 2 protein [Isoptericola sp. NPDC057559]|uniref:glycosyltransferase family 2 protein n=1 Tax=Isoptericola sp. NPDC057559 TaxID=3346168 RepID=UPI00367BF586
MRGSAADDVDRRGASRVSVVVTSHDQGELVAEAVASAQRQTTAPETIIVVDDGSTDAASLDVVDRLSRTGGVVVHRQANAGVSAARNAGFALATTPLVAVLDGDDRFEPTYLERTTAVLDARPDVLAASSWLRARGVLDAVVRPGGGVAADFLHRNACPAEAVVRKDAWERCGGYDEAMRHGFEDWDFFLGMLGHGGRIEIVPEPLLLYRTTPVSSNVRSMDRRIELYGRIVDKHRPLFEAHLRETLLALELRSTERQARWEDAVAADPDAPLPDPTFGDGGMASAVRVRSRRSAPPPR